MAALWSTEVPLNLSLYNSSDPYGNCSNDYCIPDEDYVALIEKYVFPTPYEWVLISMHLVVFVLGLIGNALVCAAVYRNPGMRTVTNYFLVNLAVADFLVILLCLPPTVLWDVTETWFMGMVLCKIVLYFQTVSVAVSVMTLTLISVERWYAICFPLLFRSTIRRAKRAIALIWIVALLFDVPELVVLRTQPKELRVESILLTQCSPSWGRQSDMIFHYVKCLLLYTLPLVFMSVAYSQIARVLWRRDHLMPSATPAEVSCGAERDWEAASTRGRSGGGGEGVAGGVASVRGRGRGRLQLSGTDTHGRVRSRRKAAKMLGAVVVLFAICYFPVHLLNILRYTTDIPQTEATVAMSLVSHWLCYANSALNPLIYNFMSGKFRKEFRRTFGCNWTVSRDQSRSARSRGRAFSQQSQAAAPLAAIRAGGGSTAVLQLRTVAQLNRTNVEVIPLATFNGNGTECGPRHSRDFS